MQKDKIYEAEEFELSLKAYLSYVSRKMKKNENYSPHPLVRALVNAIDGALETGKPGRYVGVSGDANHFSDGEARQMIACVIEMNRDNTMTILGIEDISLQKSIPIKVASYILLLSIKFDKYEGDYIKVEDFIDIVNNTIPQLNIIRFNNDEWKQARDYLAENMDTLKIPYEMSEEYEKDFLSIKESTPWEEYPQRVRSTIASIWMQYQYPELYKEGAVNTVSVFLDEEYPKAKILNNILIMLYGPTSEYFGDVLKWNLFNDLNANEGTSKISAKIGRNDLCPCGSKKKYKKCCGR
ncbi:YecA family protein [Metabacillus niabensis]|uniref:YecA family protein n=1 Tax=Metabacillus niabensis TaxID=324854 RepID=UPI00399FA8B1